MNTNNLKPFDLEKAKAGAAVCTRDGRDVRIICFDKKGKTPIVALLDVGSCEVVFHYHSNGREYEKTISDYDLCMKTKHRELFFGVARISTGMVVPANTGFPNEDDARKYTMDVYGNCLCVSKAEFEE